MSRKSSYDLNLVLIVLILLGFGLAMVFSAASVSLGNAFSLVFSRQFVFVVTGLVFLLAAMRIDYNFYSGSRRLTAAWLLVIALLIAVFFFPAFNGARRWIVFGPLRVQPSELAKLVIIVITAYFLSRPAADIRSLKKGMLPYAGILAPILALILAEPDLGTSFCIGLTAFVMLFLAGLQWRYMLAMVLAAIPGVYLFILRVPYRRNRVLTFIDPSLDPYGSGYQIRQSLIAIGSGGWQGLGYAQGNQKKFFLPEPHTDFIFSVIGEELGLWGTLLTLTLFILLFIKGIKIALRADTKFGAYLGLGIVSMFTFQALINMSVVLSLMPTKGLPLPFVSVGGSSMVVALVAVGILLNISKQGRREADISELMGVRSETYEHS